ncbi:RNA-dependent RNA polymerase 1, partial [Dictyocoela roeselum]
FQRFVRRARWIENFKVVGIVENPACMVGLLGASFQLCALSRSLKYFYRDMFKRAEIVFHNSNDSLECKRGGSAEDLALFFEKTFPHLLPVLHSLISEGAFSVESFVAVHRDELGDYIPFFGQYKIKSSKLEILADLVNFVEGERIIVVKNPELVPYVQKEIGNSAKVISPMEIGEITDQKIINFGLVNLHTHEKSYIFMSENEEKIYDAIMNAENQFETQPRQTIEMIEDNFDDTISGSQIKLIEPGNKGIARKIYYVCKFRLDICNILKDKGFEIVRNLNRMFIHPARQPNSITDFGFNLASLINFPISPRGYPRIKTSHVLFIKYVTFGHVINHNFFNQKKFYGKGVLYLTPKSITLFFFTREINLKMEIENSLEKYLFLDQKDNFLNIYFLMKSYPKIFVLKSIDIGRLEELIGKYRQGHHIFDVLEWKRATFADIDFMNNRYDLRVNVDLKLACNQEIPTKELEKYFFNPKDIILNLLTMYSAGVYLYPITEHYNKSLGVDDIMKKITNFDVRYMFMCLFSHKGRYISHKFSEAHIDLILKKANIKKFCDFIEIVVEDRNFEPERIITDFFEKETNTYVSEELKNAVYLRSAYITPLSIIYNYPKISPTNRVLRNFDPDKFIRISFREDNTLDRVYNSQDEVYDYFRSVLNDGFFICDRKYFFLASSASQLRLHAAWFVTPHVKNKELVGPDYIRSWLGNFDDIHNIGKYTIRLGQALSATIMDIEIDEFVEEKDAISSTGYCFTDGVGKISEKLAKRRSEKLELPQVPSAFQIRFAGYKGVVSIDPRIKDSEPGLVMRESMKKFHSSHNKLEVVSWSQEIPAHLNRQIILILESLGITESTFTDLHEECIFHHFFTTPRSTDFLDNHCAFFKPTPKFMHHTFFQKLLIAAYNKQLSDLHKKEKIFLRKGRILMGVIDEFDVLEKEEVFVMTRIDGIYAPITGQVLVAKNPCLHPGDIRLVTAVDRKELYHMRDVLIFSKRGKRPIFNMCSGSDLDGDLYFCSWEPRLIPPKTYTADNYISSCHLYKTVVSMTDIVNFFIKFMRDNELGSIANAHLAFSDQKIRGVTAPESLKLATLFNMGVDFPKTGFVARLPLDLTPTIYPDFMNIKGQPSYKSTKTLGVLYRRSKMLKFNILSLCDCINCISKCFLNELKVLVNGLVILEKRGFRNENKFNENEQNSRIKSQNNN